MTHCRSRRLGGLPSGLPSLSPTTETGVSFPAFLEDGRRLLGTGVRRKSIMGLKNIDVYAFGVYADDKMMKKVLAEKYGKLSVSELKDSTDLSEDVLDQDLGMTVRLQIAYGRLSIRSVRSAFEESICWAFKVNGTEVGAMTKQAVGTIYTRSLHWQHCCGARM